LNYLGKISYGMYMTHILIINVSITILYWLKFEYLLYPTIFIVTILVSAISYEYFEQYFLRKKKAYARILTG
jgi:peptidoglycan/LPS O-acetylase OafA/YrhL